MKSKIDTFRKPKEFKATFGMRAYAWQRAKLGEDVSDAEICRVINIRPETICAWKHVEGYFEWLEDTVSRFRHPIHDLLESIAVYRADDHKFWTSLALRYKYLTESSKDQPDINRSESERKEFEEKLLSAVKYRLEEKEQEKSQCPA